METRVYDCAYGRRPPVVRLLLVGAILAAGLGFAADAQAIDGGAGTDTAVNGEIVTNVP